MTACLIVAIPGDRRTSVKITRPYLTELIIADCIVVRGRPTSFQ